MLILKNFLSQVNRDRIYQMMCSDRLRFVAAEVKTDEGWVEDKRIRVAQRCSQFSPWKEFFDATITTLVPSFTKALDIEPFTPRIECRLARTGHGGFFATHVDNAGKLLSKRRITFVYYVHTGEFSGGDLVFADRRITPEDNSLVVFSSDLRHHVEPVTLIPDDFHRGRFTIHGWCWEQ